MIIAIAIGLFYYVFSIPEPEGLSLASWPDTFTDNFSFWIQYENGTVGVKERGLALLDEYVLWIQVIDETGQEVFIYNKPGSYPTSYTASELLVLYESAYEDGNTVFVNSFEDSSETWNYIIGFPYAIGKYMLYYNGENVGRLSPLVSMIVFLALGALILFILVYGFWLSRHLWVITGGIGDISQRTYEPLKESGTFSNIYTALNKMDIEIRNSDKIKRDTDRVRREWVANITHDLKTPLSPVKGYAELLADDSAVEPDTVRKYGSIILKNVNHAEKLMNDLKLTYQLESGAIPHNPQEVRLIRFLKELVIDIVNDPAFGGRNIEFESDMPELVTSLDSDLFRRAIGNLVINALVHNAHDTKVTIVVLSEQKDEVSISVRDNGRGMSVEEQTELFTRYYRGTSTGERPEGSGLGLAIAKQIVTLHGGDISIKSKPGEGTEFRVTLPI